MINYFKIRLRKHFKLFNLIILLKNTMKIEIFFLIKKAPKETDVN